MSASASRRLPAVLLFLFVFVIAALSVHSADTWTHLAAGRWILLHGRIPAVDPFSYTHHGRLWQPYDWLGDAALAKIRLAWGDYGLIVVKSAAIAAGFALLLPLAPGSEILLAGLLALAACSAWPGLTELPSCFDFLFLAAFLRILHPRRAFRWRMFWALLGLELVWANLHPAGAALGLVVVAVKTFKAETRRRPDRGRWLLLLAGTMAAAAFRPGGSWGTLWLLLHGAVLPSDVKAPGLLGLHGLFVIAGAVSAWVCLLEEFFLGVSAVAALGLSVVAPGWEPCAAMIAAPVIALALGHFVKPPKATGNSVALLGIGMLVLLLGYFGFVSLPFAAARGFSTRQTPQGALEFLDANHIGGRMFNDLGSSSYLLWRGGEARPVFVDQRDAEDPAFYQDALAWPARWSLLDQVYRFDYAVVENARGYPCRALDEDLGWTLAYWDDASLVYVRREPENQRVILFGGFSHVRPNDLFDPFTPDALSKKEADATLGELDRAMEYAPRDVSPPLLKAIALIRLGRADKAAPLIRAAASRSYWKPQQTALLASALDEQGDAVGALSAYRQALQSASMLGERRLGSKISEKMANIHLRAGDHREALRCLREAVDLDPGNVEAAESFQSLTAARR